MKYRSFTEYKREVTASPFVYIQRVKVPVAFSPSITPLSSPSRIPISIIPHSSPNFPLHQITFPSIRYSIPTQEAGNTLVTSLELHVYMVGSDHLLTDGSPAHDAVASTAAGARSPSARPLIREGRYPTLSLTRAMCAAPPIRSIALPKPTKARRAERSSVFFVHKVSVQDPVAVALVLPSMTL
ncbi:hypothetical protein EVAR_74727_1 [Eumeta japonica]|uniref:Uncharacterized protein n=1 Tax=Eumeta variegata TaxID=151549 RepID=A0A4C1SPS8_EUMVA|nr:hypothetical protein EVAR_74727_1 [Eumeta japonica]